MRAKEFINESKTTLNNIYDGDYPDEDELIWNFVGNQDFDVPFTVKTLSADTLKHMLLDTYGVDELKDLFRKMQPDQKATIEYYKDDPSLSNHIIIVNKNIIVDGNHRALAAVLANKNIKCVDISEEPIDEEETGTPNAREISNQLRAAGYSNVGSGADASVWSKDDSHVIKILMPEDASSNAEQVFRKFYDFSMSHQDVPCVPRFNEVNTIDINGKDYTQIEMERLIPLESNSFVEGLIWYLSDYVSTSTPWPTIESELANPKTWDIYSPNYANAFAKTWQSLLENPASKKTYSMYKQLYNVMKLLYQTGNINKFGWDLHTANVMQRKNGQPVIIDPWFSEGTS